MLGDLMCPTTSQLARGPEPGGGDVGQGRHRHRARLLWGAGRAGLWFRI